MELDLMDPGCVATYEWKYYSVASPTPVAVPAWITTTTGGTAYDRTLDASISEMGSFANIGTHFITVKGTLQDGQTYTRTWTFVLSFGCETVSLATAGT